MASRVFSELKTLGRRRVQIDGSFAPNGSSALAAAGVKGEGFAVEYVSTGLYLITFTDKYVDVISKTSGLQLSTADNRSLQFGDYDADASTLAIRSVDEDGTVQDIAADANNRISFSVVFSDTTAV